MFLFSRMYRPAMKSNQPPTKWLLVVLPPLKGPEQEVNHLPPSSVDVKNVCGAILLHPLHVIMACTGQTSHLLMYQQVHVTQECVTLASQIPASFMVE